jgi:hypothetical protein
MEKVKWRRDSVIGEDNEFKTVFAWQLPASGRTIREGLLILYSLTPFDGQEPTIYLPGMTHEFTLYEIDPGTPVDFETSLLQQKNLSPLVPAVCGFQFRAKSTQDAVARVEDLVGRVLRLELPPDVTSEWLPFMRDGVDITSELVDVGQVIEKSNVQRRAGGERIAIPDEMKKRYRFEKAPSWGRRVALVAACMGVGAVISAGFAMATVGPDMEQIADFVHDFRGDEFYKEVQQPNGEVTIERMRKVKGMAHRYEVLERAKLEPEGGSSVLGAGLTRDAAY